MATPITHIVYAEKVFDELFSDLDRGAFYRGTSFPDIRKLLKIPRKQTHIFEGALSHIDKENSLQAGIEFHNFLDESREIFMKEKGFYNIYEPNKITVNAFKFLEDEISYPQINDWQRVIDLLNDTSDLKRNWVIKPESIDLWFSGLISYISKPPTSETRMKLCLMWKIMEEEVDEINRVIDEMREDDSLVAMIKDFNKYFNALMGLE